MFPPNPPPARLWRRAAARLTALAALLAAFSASPLHAQLLRGRITGPSGEPVAAALVQAASASDTAQAWTRSDEGGRYALRLPPGGPWTVRVQRIGFAPHVATVARADAAHDVVLSARATMLDPLQVRGSPAAIHDIPGGQGGSASSRRASTLEWTTTAPGDLGEAALLAEGTVPVDAGGSGVPGVSIAGQAPGANRVTADGAAWGGASLPAEGVKSVGVVAETYDVARGQFTGGQIAATTHSGTRDPGGAVRVRVAGNPVDRVEDAQTSSPDGMLALLSGAYGGPLVPDRLFGFAAGQLSANEWDVRPLAGNPAGTLRGRGLDPDSVQRLDSLLTQAGLAAGGAQKERGYTLSLLARLDWKPSPAHDVGLRVDYRRSRRPLPAAPTNLSAAGGWGSGGDGGVLGTVVSRGRATTNELRVYGALGASSTRPDEELPGGMVGVGGDGEGMAGLSFGGQQMRGSSRRGLLEANDVFRWTFGGGAQRLQVGGTLGLERAGLRSAPEAFGTFYFQDLRALEDARPASYTRRLSGRDAAVESRYAAFFAGHTWQASRALGVTWGVRLEQQGYGGRADYDPAVAAAFPGLEDGVPSAFTASPRMGFHYRVPHASGNSRLTFRGGVGRFVGRVPLEPLAFAAGETGTEDRTLVCVGDAAPAADWEALRDPANAPVSCAGGADGSGTVRTATAFAGDFSAPRLWRASLSGEWQPIARIRLAASGTVLRGDGLATARDLNLADAPAFTLEAEGGRGVLAPAVLIDPATGLVPPLAGRPHAGLGTVRRIGADARSGTTQLTGSLMYVPRGVFRIGVLSYTYTRQWDEASALNAPGGALAVAGADPRALLRGPGDWERRHALQLTYSQPLWRTARVAVMGRLTSGAPYTPLVAGDVNGDGAANDAAFVFDRHAADPAVAAGMARLLNEAPGHAASCLRRQAGRMAGRNSCRGPWTGTLDAQLLLPVRVGERPMELSLQAANLPSLADYVWTRGIMGEDEVAGWGRAALPDATLLQVRGFDADRRAFTYEVNRGFGQSLQRRGGLFAAFSVTLQVRFAIRADPAEQWIVADARREAAVVRPLHELRATVAQRAPNLPLRLLGSADSLGLALTADQARALTLLADSVQLVLPPLLDSLASAAHLADTASQASSPARFRLRAYTGIAGEMLDSVQAQVRAVLTPEQWSRVPAPWREPSGRSPLVPMKPMIIGSDDVW